MKQAKKAKTNCPAHIPSQAPPFPRTLATPFFRILASPSADETFELANDSVKNGEVGSIAEKREDPSTKSRFFSSKQKFEKITDRYLLVSIWFQESLQMVLPQKYFQKVLILF